VTELEAAFDRLSKEVPLAHDTSVVDHHAAVLEFQQLVEHYLEDVMEAARGRRTRAAQ